MPFIVPQIVASVIEDHLPNSSVTFDTVRDAYKDLIKRIVPVQGIGLSLNSIESPSPTIACNRGSKRFSVVCPFKIYLWQGPRSRRWKIDYDRSPTAHNHAPTAEILDDPSWLPFVKTPDAREALGLAQLGGAGKKLKQIDEAPATTKRKLNAYTKAKEEARALAKKAEKVRLLPSLFRRPS